MGTLLYFIKIYGSFRLLIIKEGWGKPTTTASLGETLAKKGFKVLRIDLDPQGNLSQILGIDTPEVQVSDSLIDNVEFPIINIHKNLDRCPQLKD